MVVSDRNISPNDEIFDPTKFLVNLLQGINNWAVYTIEGFNQWIIENRHILYPLFNKGIDIFAQLAKTQFKLWYDTQNEIHKNYNPYFRYLPALSYNQNYSTDTTRP